MIKVLTASIRKHFLLLRVCFETIDSDDQRVVIQSTIKLHDTFERYWHTARYIGRGSKSDSKMPCRSESICRHTNPCPGLTFPFSRSTSTIFLHFLSIFNVLRDTLLAVSLPFCFCHRCELSHFTALDEVFFFTFF